MTEGMHDPGKHEPMFYCGAQTNADGDMLPSSFTVFPPSSDSVIFYQEDAVLVLLEKITESLSELDIVEAIGMITFAPICTWEMWAELEVSDEVKMAALVEAITNRTLSCMTIAVSTTKNFLQGVWAPAN